MSVEERKVKILMVNPSSNKFGGGAMVSNYLAIGLDKKKYEVFLFFPESSEMPRFLEDKAGINIVFPKRNSFLQICEFLKTFISDKRIDIVHAHGTRAKFWAWFALLGLHKRKKPKFIYTVHGFHIIHKRFPLNFLLILLEQLSNRWIDIVTCVSEGDRKLLLQWKTVPKNKVEVVKNGIAVEKFKVATPLVVEKKKSLGLKDDELILMSIARLHPPKDISTVLKAFQLVRKSHSNVRLLVIGDGPLRQALETEAKSLSIIRQVQFLGYRDDIPELLNVADIVILSTNWEGLPLVPLEAAACKKPVIASDVIGVQETVVNGETGYLFKKGDAHDLAEKIKNLLENPELRRKMGENGYRFVIQNFSLENMVLRYDALYEKIMSRHEDTRD